MAAIIKVVIVKNILFSVVFISPLLFLDIRLDFSAVTLEKGHQDPLKSTYRVRQK